MILKLTNEETRELREALFEMRAELLRSLAEGMGCGYSARNMSLCARKARLERLIERLDHPPEAIAIPEVGQGRLAVAA